VPWSCAKSHDAFRRRAREISRRFMAFARLRMVDMTTACASWSVLQATKHAGVMMPTNVAGKYIDESESSRSGCASRPVKNRCVFIRPTALAI